MLLESVQSVMPYRSWSILMLGLYIKPNTALIHAGLVEVWSKAIYSV